jgi:hypothetical protein
VRIKKKERGPPPKRQPAILLRLVASYQLPAVPRYLQQSPGQQPAPPVQQLAPQQGPGQHFADFEQQAAPVAANADSENSDAASRANSFVFMIEFLSV